MVPDVYISLREDGCGDEWYRTSWWFWWKMITHMIPSCLFSCVKMIKMANDFAHYISNHLTYFMLAPNRRQAIIWVSDVLFYWCIYASVGLNELTVGLIFVC